MIPNLSRLSLRDARECVPVGTYVGEVGLDLLRQFDEVVGKLDEVVGKLECNICFNSLNEASNSWLGDAGDPRASEWIIVCNNNHVFHKACIKATWDAARGVGTCPDCRAEPKEGVKDAGYASWRGKASEEQEEDAAANTEEEEDDDSSDDEEPIEVFYLRRQLMDELTPSETWPRSIADFWRAGPMLYMSRDPSAFYATSNLMSNLWRPLYYALLEILRSLRGLLDAQYEGEAQIPDDLVDELVDEAYTASENALRTLASYSYRPYTYFARWLKELMIVIGREWRAFGENWFDRLLQPEDENRGQVRRRDDDDDAQPRTIQRTDQGTDQSTNIVELD